MYILPASLPTLVRQLLGLPDQVHRPCCTSKCLVCILFVKSNLYILTYTRERSYPEDLVPPLIGYFNVGSRHGDTWCYPPMGGMGDRHMSGSGEDESSESMRGNRYHDVPEHLLLELFASDVNVVPVRRAVRVNIVRDDGKCVTFTITNSTNCQL